MQPRMLGLVCAAVIALALGACSSPYSPAALANQGMGGTSSGPSTLSTQSKTVATVGGKSIPLPYVIYAPQTKASDANHVYGIEFLDYDPCTWGTQHGWNTWPTTTFNQLGFYFPAAPTATHYAISSSGGSGVITASSGALGTGFTASQDSNGFVCLASSWLELASGSVDVTAVDSNVGTVTGTLNITLNDGSTITGQFQSGTCSDTSSQVSSGDPNACTSER